MKKIALILSLLLFSINTLANDTFFLHPIFYQQLSGVDNDYFYVLKPNSIYYENSKTEISQSSECILLDNQEYFIKMLCNGCNDKKCLSYQSQIHIFSLTKDKMTDNNYIISHKVINKINNTEFQEILTNDGLITIPPY